MGQYDMTDEQKRFLMRHPGCGFIIFVIACVILYFMFFAK